MKISLGFMLLLLGSALTSPVPEATKSNENHHEPPLYPFGKNVGDMENPREDDGVSPPIPIETAFGFFDEKEDKLFVNNNGLLSFRIPVPGYTPEAIPLADGKRLVAPYWGDVDNTLGGKVFYRVVTDPKLLAQISVDINTYFPDSFDNTVWAFIATWDHVAYFRSSSKKTNTFQCVLATDGHTSFIMLNYGEIQWTTGAASGGDPRTGLGGIPAQAGFNSGDDKNYFSIPGSRTPQVINITHTSNVHVPGRWVFQVDHFKVTGIPEELLQSLKEAEQANSKEEQEQQSHGDVEEEPQGNHDNEANPEAERQQEKEQESSGALEEEKESQVDQTNPEAEGQQEKEQESSGALEEEKEPQVDQGNPEEEAIQDKEGNGSVPGVETPEFPLEKPLEENDDYSEESEDCEW